MTWQWRRIDVQCLDLIVITFFVIIFKHKIEVSTQHSWQFENKNYRLSTVNWTKNACVPCTACLSYEAMPLCLKSPYSVQMKQSWIVPPPSSFSQHLVMLATWWGWKHLQLVPQNRLIPSVMHSQRWNLWRSLQSGFATSPPHRIITSAFHESRQINNTNTDCNVLLLYIIISCHLYSNLANTIQSLPELFWNHTHFQIMLCPFFVYYKQLKKPFLQKLYVSSSVVTEKHYLIFCLFILFIFFYSWYVVISLLIYSQFFTDVRIWHAGFRNHPQWA